MSSALARHLGLQTVALVGNGAQSLLGGGGGPTSMLTDRIQLQLLDSSGRAVASYDVPVMFVLEHTALEMQVGMDVCQISVTGGTGHTIIPPGGGAAVPLPRLLPRRWQPGENRAAGLVGGTIRVSEEARQLGLAYRAALAAGQPVPQPPPQPQPPQAREASAEECFGGGGNIVRPPTQLRFDSPLEPGDEVLFFRQGFTGDLGLEDSELVKYNYCGSGAYGGDVAAAVVDARGGRRAVIRAALNPSGGATYMSAELAEHLGLRTVALGGSGTVSAVGGGGRVSMLVDPIQIQLLDTNGEAVASYDLPVMFVLEHVAHQLHLGPDAFRQHAVTHTSAEGHRIAAAAPAGGGNSSAAAAAGAGAADDVALPRLVPRRWQPGESREEVHTVTIDVAADTRAEAVARARAREEARRPATAEECFGADVLVRPAARLQFVNPSEQGDEVFFFRGHSWAYNELHDSELVEYNYDLAGAIGGGVAAAIVAGDGGTRHAVIRAMVDPGGSTYMSAELAEHLGLRTVALGGSGTVSAAGGGGRAWMLVDPIQIQLLDTNGRAFASYPAPLVFVFERAPFELHIGPDVCPVSQVNGFATIVALPDGTSSVMTPRLVPRRWQPGEGRVEVYTCSVWPADDTFEEAVARVAARAGVRARLAAAAQGQDPVAASARAESTVQRTYAEGAPGRVWRPGGRQRPPQAPPAPQQGSAAWVEDWLPPQYRSGGSGGGRGSRRRRGRGHSRRRGGRGGARGGGEGSSEEVDEEGADVVSGGVATDPFAGLPPLPPALRSARWVEVAATHLPAGDTECVVCAWSLTGAAEAGAAEAGAARGAAAAAGGGGGAGEAVGLGPGDVVVQLGCRHTFHELCVRQMLQRQSRHGAHCPLCRMAIC